MLPPLTRPWHRYGVVFLALLVGTLLAFPIQHAAGGRVPFVTFFPVITLVAALAGTGPGLLCTLFSGLIVAYFWMNPIGSVAIHDSANLIALAMYLVAGAVISLVGGALRRAQLARRDSSTLLRVLLDSAPGLIYLKDRDGTYRMVNKRFADLAGRSPENLIGKNDTQAFGDSLDQKIIRANDVQVLASGQTTQLEEHLQTPQGPRTYLSIKTPVEYEGEILLCGFTTDITDRKRTEDRDRFLVSLDDAIRPLTDPNEITHAAARLLGEYLSVDRCAYADVEDDQDTFNLTGDFNRPGVPSIVGRYRFLQFGAECLRLMREGEPYIVTDASADPRITPTDRLSYEQTLIRSVICVPLLKSGRFVAAMAVHMRTPRTWRPDEADLLLTVAARCWESIARAKIARDLRENEERLRMAQEAGGVGTFEFDIATGKSRGSEVFRRVFNVPDGSHEYTADAWATLVHPGDRERVFTALRYAIDSPDVTDCSDEYRLLYPDHTTRWISYQGRVTRENGIARRIIGTITDVTDRRAADEALRQSEARFRALSDQAPVPISVSRQGKQLYVNEAFRACFGIPPGTDIVGMPVLEQAAPEDHALLLGNIRKRYAGEFVPSTYQYTGLRADGSRLTVEIHVGQIELPDGPASIAFLSDISDRTRAQNNLRLLADAGTLLSASLEYERALADLARLVVPRLADWCAIDMLQPDGNLRRLAVVHPDPAKVELAHELHRRFPDDRNAQGGTWDVIRTGKPSFYPLIPDELLAASIKDPEHLRLLRALHLHSYVGVPLIARSRVLGVLTLVYAESGRTYTPEDVALAEDLARRAATAIDNATLYEAERSARAEAERASRLKDDFLATLSHELRTPLNAILGWSQLLSSHIGPHNPDDVSEGLRVIERNARAQTQLIEDLLDLSRITAGKLRLDVQTLSPADVVSAAIDSVAPAADAKGIRLQKILDPSAGPITGDPGRLQQAIWNLLTNAVKFTPKGGRIQIVVARVSSHIQITVSDTGQGIDPAFLPHMFERFRQADASTTRLHGGLGIGLALVKQLVELHGGTVSAHSDGENLGSTFTLSLPLAIARNTLPSSPLTNTSAPSLTGISVLLVDDEPDARLLAKKILEDRGAKVTTAANATEALSLLQQHLPNVLLSDIGMPEHDGYDLISWIRNLPPSQGGKTPAAAFTAFARTEDRQRALQAGYHSHLTKPVEPSELITLVASLATRT